MLSLPIFIRKLEIGIPIFTGDSERIKFLNTSSHVLYFSFTSKYNFIFISFCPYSFSFVFVGGVSKERGPTLLLRMILLVERLLDITYELF